MATQSLIAARAAPKGARERAFFAVVAPLFIVSSVVTVLWCSSMSSMAGMEMLGGWTMSMTWMRMPGQSWLDAARSFLGMWIVMMVPMMLPALVPMLLRYRRAVVRSRSEAPLGRLTMMVGVAYFLVWAAVGAVIFPFGVALAEMEMRHTTLAEIAPFAIGVVVVIAGALQFSPWKTRQLVYCREGHCGCRALRADARTAFRHGLRIGLHCCYCCANLTAILLVIGVMDLRAMAVVTAAITLERLAAAGERSARVIGAVIVAAGIFVTTKAVGLG